MARLSYNSYGLTPCYHIGTPVCGLLMMLSDLLPTLINCDMGPLVTWPFPLNLLGLCIGCDPGAIKLVNEFSSRSFLLLSNSLCNIIVAKCLKRRTTEAEVPASSPDPWHRRVEQIFL